MGRPGPSLVSTLMTKTHHLIIGIFESTKICMLTDCIFLQKIKFNCYLFTHKNNYETEDSALNSYY